MDLKWRQRWNSDGNQDKNDFDGSNPTAEMPKISFLCGLDNKKSRTQIARSGFFIVSDKPPEQERTVFLKQSARGENARRKYQAQRAVRGAAEYEVFIGKFFGF